MHIHQNKVVITYYYARKNIANEIYDFTIQCGFDNCGVISINEMDGFEELYQKRINNAPMSKYFYSSVGNRKRTKKNDFRGQSP